MAVVHEFPILRTRRHLADEDAREVAASCAAALRTLATLSDTDRTLLWQFLSAASKALITQERPALADALAALGMAAVTAAGRPDGARLTADVLDGRPS